MTPSCTRLSENSLPQSTSTGRRTPQRVTGVAHEHVQARTAVGAKCGDQGAQWLPYDPVQKLIRRVAPERLTAEIKLLAVNSSARLDVAQA
jgi:hypothetical protein